MLGFEIWAEPKSSLHHFEFQPATADSEDNSTTILQLTCIDCGEVLCDVEKEDSLADLVNVAKEHWCPDEDDTD